MSALLTDWRSRITNLDAKDDSGQTMLWPWLAGSDDSVALDLGAQLDTGETLSVGELTLTLWQLRAYDEAADVDKTGTMVSGTPQITGSVVLQRLTGLERGRVYRLEVLHGPAGNKRGASLLVHCPE